MLDLDFWHDKSIYACFNTVTAVLHNSYFVHIFYTYFLQQVLCRFIQSTDSDYVQLCLVTTVFDIRLRTMTESTCKILKLGWKTFEIFSSKEWEPRITITAILIIIARSKSHFTVHMGRQLR